MPLQFVKSSKNKELLVHNNYIFKKDYERKGKIYWKCVKYDTDKCRGRVHSYLEEIVCNKEEHNHVSESVDIEARKILSNIRERATESLHSTPHQILSEAIGVPSEALAGILPRVSAMKKVIQRVRKLNNGVPPLPCYIEGINYTSTIYGYVKEWTIFTF